MSDPSGARTQDSNTSRIRGYPLKPPGRPMKYRKTKENKEERKQKRHNIRTKEFFFCFLTEEKTRRTPPEGNI